MAISTDEYKQLLGSWATGVTIVTARAGDHIHGMTVTAFTEVSLDPPLVLVCAAKSSNTHPVIEEGGVFAVNILGSDQQDLSNRFASKKDEHKRFEGVKYDSGATGAPLLEDALGVLDCRVVSAHDEGDHIIYVGEVEQLRVTGREPLIYFRGKYSTVSELA
ncbi:flavin reductase family protein [Myxococcota bacterium]|nr:flavin reductase family protein [Myxococcota bacterium]